MKINKEKVKDWIALLALAASLVIAGIILTLCFASCSTQERIITVPEVRVEQIHTIDTVKEKDTVRSERTTTIRELDSAAMAKYGIQLRNAERAWLIETNELKQQISELTRLRELSAQRSDSIPVPYPVEVEVPAVISGWQWAQIWAGRIAMILVMLTVGCWLLYRQVIRKYIKQ